MAGSQLLVHNCEVTVTHFATKSAYNKIMSGGLRGSITLKASSPAKGNPSGVYVTPMSLADITEKPGGFKSHLGLTREKSEDVIQFKVSASQVAGRSKGGRGHVWHSLTDLVIFRSNIVAHGKVPGL